jgi:hypothetical protein
MPTVALRHAASPLEIAPLARLDAGELRLHGPEFPPTGPVALVLWKPGASPAFALVHGRVGRDGARWRFSGPEEGHVLLWQTSPGHPARGS